MRTKCALGKLSIQTDEAHSLMLRALKRYPEQSTVIEQKLLQFWSKKARKAMNQYSFQKLEI